MAVSTNGGKSFDFEALVPGFPGDTSADGLASPIRGNQAASDPWLSFDSFGNLFFAFVAFQRTPPGRPDFDPADTNAIAVAKYIATPAGVQYDKTVVVERGNVGGAGCTGMDVFYNQADTAAAGPLTFGSEVRVTSGSFNPNLYGSIKAITPFIGDYITVVSNGANAFVVWTDNRDINPTANAQEDASTATDPPALINARSRDSNVYFQKIVK